MLADELVFGCKIAHRSEFFQNTKAWTQSVSFLDQAEEL